MARHAAAFAAWLVLAVLLIAHASRSWHVIWTIASGHTTACGPRKIPQFYRTEFCGWGQLTTECGRTERQHCLQLP
jgi:hypothetical protein